MPEVIELTPDKLKKLEKAYQDADSKGISILEFEGHEILTDYAKYMVKYAKLQFGMA